MKIQGLNKRSPVPLYQQLARELTRQIEAGELHVGSRLPSEREMAEQLNVSRITARQAIEELAAQGLVYREHGRGTFVAQPKMSKLQGFASFSQDIIARGFQPSSRVVTQELMPVNEDIQRTLQIEPGDQAHFLVRVRLADERPVALQSSYIPYRLCPGLENEDFSSQSLFAVLQNKYFVYPAWTEVEMEALPASTEEAHWLEIEEGDPVLVVRGLTYTDSFEIVENVRTVYRGRGLVLYIGRQRISTQGG